MSVLLDRIAASHAEAEKSMEALKSAITGRDQASIFQNLRAFLLQRFLIYDEAVEEENLEKLAQLSIVKVRELSSEEKLGGDVSRTCTGVSSAEQKNILFLLLLQRRLGIRFDPMRTAYIETLSQLSEEIYLLTKQ